MSFLPYEIPCVILCGGKSSRMGEDKSLLPFSNSNSLAQYQYDRLKPYFKTTYISSKINKFDFLDEKSLIYDDGEIFSPLVALKTIFEKLKNEKYLFIITVDTPLVKINSIHKIIQKIENFDVCVAKTEKIHNLCGIFSTNLRDKIELMLSQDIHKIGYLLNNSKTNYVNFENEDEFININNKIEYEKSLKIIS